MTTRSAIGTEIPATRLPIASTSTRHVAITKEMRNETWGPPRLPSGGLPGPQYRDRLPHPLNDPSTRTIEWPTLDGPRTNPLVIVEVSSASHPFWTGTPEFRLVK